MHRRTIFGATLIGLAGFALLSYSGSSVLGLKLNDQDKRDLVAFMRVL